MNFKAFLFLTVLFVLLVWLGGCGATMPDPDYTTRHGVEVWVDANLEPSKQEVEAWTEEVLEIWMEIYPEWIECSRRALMRSAVRFKAQCPVADCVGEPAKGCAFPRGDVYVGDCWRDRVFQHEVSHLMALDCENIWNLSHEFFKNVELGR